ncbi:hypothetical protein Tco_1022495 [Tanacetum coccineum]
MATNDKESSAAGTDNRPPMLEEITTREGEQQTHVAREKTDEEFIEAEAFLADVECTTPYAEPLAITTTIEFEVSHEDAYDSDVDEAPHAVAAFMANLMQIGPSTGQGTSNDIDFHSEVHTYDNHFFDNMNLQVSQEIHRGEQLDSNVDSVINDHDNTIPYHQYQLNNEVESVPTDVSYVVHGEISVITILDDLRSQLEGHIKTNEEKSFANVSLKVELERYKTRVQNLEQSKAESNKSLKTESEKLKADKNALEESYLEELVWLRNTNKDLHKFTLGHRNPMYLKSAQLCSPTLYLGDVIVDPIHTPFRVYDSEETLVQAELKDQLQWKDESIRKLKAQIGKIKEVSVGPNLSTLEFQALETKNTQLKEELTTVKIKNDSLRDENMSIKKRYQDLYQSKAESNSNVSSRAVVPEKPKVLAPGLYAMTPKYIPPQKRNNREANTPLPRKETVSLVKKSNVCVNLYTGIKSVTEASKSKSKCEMKTHRNLPTRSENCGVKNLIYMNAKNPKVNNDATVKQLWKATGKIFACVGSKWRPTGRKFTLGDTCPLTRITKPEVVPLEKSGSVSTSEPANNVIMTPRNMSSNTSDYIYPIIVPSDVDVEDAFSSTTTPNYTPASPDYSPTSLGNTSPNPSDDLSKYLLASLAISPFHNDLYMKVMQAYNNATSDESPIPPPQAPIAPITVLPLSSMFDPQDFFLLEKTLPPNKRAYS